MDNYFKMIKRKKGYDVRGALLMIVMLIIIATGLASSIAIDIFLNKSVSKDEYKYEIQLLKIKRGINRFLYSGEWSVLINTDSETKDPNLGTSIQNFYSDGGSFSAGNSDVMVSYNTKDQQIYFGDHSYSDYYDTSGSYSHYGNISNKYMNANESYRVNTIKFLRRLMNLGYLSMSPDEIESPTVFGYCGQIVDSELTLPVWCAGDLDEISSAVWLDD